MGEETIRLTIVTVVKNGRAFLQETYQGLRSQSTRQFVWLVIDGKSTDGTLEWLGEISDLKVEICSEKDKTIYDAMNKAVGKVKTEYILFLNAGDVFFDSTVLHKILGCIHDAPSDIYYGLAMLGAVPGFKRRPQGEHLKSINTLFYGKIPCHQSMVISKNCFAETGYYLDEMGVYADRDWLLRYVKASGLSKMFYMDYVVVEYQPTGKSYQQFYKNLPHYLKMIFKNGNGVEVLFGLVGIFKSAVYVSVSKLFSKL